jgi:hypothetical protein
MSKLTNKDMYNLRGAYSLNIDDPDMKQGRGENYILEGNARTARKNLSKIMPQINAYNHQNIFNRSNPQQGNLLGGP